MLMASIRRPLLAVAMVLALTPFLLAAPGEPESKDKAASPAEKLKKQLDQTVTLEITEQPGRCRCRTCGQDFSPDGPILLCPCGSADVEVLAGQELKIASVKVA